MLPVALHFNTNMKTCFSLVGHKQMPRVTSETPTMFYVGVMTLVLFLPFIGNTGQYYSLGLLNE